MDTDWSVAEDPLGARTRELRIERAGQRPVTGAVWLPDSPEAGSPLVAVGHGASGDRYQVPIPYLADRLTREAGYAVLSLDGPVHGLRQVGPGGREALAAEMQRASAVDEMVEDWQLALTAARGLPEVGEGALAYFGLSMGSMFGIPLLSARQDVDVAVLGLLGTSGPAVRGLAGIAFSSEDKRLHANPGPHPALPLEQVDLAFDFLRAHLDGTAKREILDPLAGTG